MNVCTNRHGRSLGGQDLSVFVSSAKYVGTSYEVRLVEETFSIMIFRPCCFAFWFLYRSMCTPQLFVLLQACGAFALPVASNAHWEEHDRAAQHNKYLDI